MRILTKLVALFSGIILATFSCQSLSNQSLSREVVSSSNPELQIGIRQRFGEKDSDRVEIIAPKDGWLTLDFLQAHQPIAVKTTRLSLGVDFQEVPQLVSQERVVLSSHRSFEDAEESALRWEKRGVPSEITKPTNRDWEVWAKREKYNTPDSKRQLVQELHNQGFRAVVLVSQQRQQVPQLYWVANGQRYEGDTLEIQSSQSTQRVTGIPVPTWMKVPQDGMPFPGSMKVQPNAYGSYTIVNNVRLEDYLRGVVPREILPNKPLAAAESQAIIARTYALRNLRRFQVDNYQLCADDHCQVYTGWQDTTSLADRAIRNTRGQVLTYRGELIDALYSSTTGGITAPFEDIWQGQPRPYLKAILDSREKIWNLQALPLNHEDNFKRFLSLTSGFNESGSQFFRWREKRSLTDLTAQLRDYLQKKQNPLKEFQKLESIAVTARSPSGRVLQTKILTERGEVNVDKEEIMYVFKGLKSTLFYLEPIAGNDGKLQGYTFIGGGFGHGIGLSQISAIRLASLGWSSVKILDFYYPGTRLQPLTPNIIYWQPPKN